MPFKLSTYLASIDYLKASGIAILATLPNAYHEVILSRMGISEYAAGRIRNHQKAYCYRRCRCRVLFVADFSKTNGEGIYTFFEINLTNWGKRFWNWYFKVLFESTRREPQLRGTLKK